MGSRNFRGDCMKNIISISMIALLFSQSAFAKGRPSRTRYTNTTYSHTTTYRGPGYRVNYDVYEYEACYERPRTKVIHTRNQRQRDNGLGMMVGGAVIAGTGAVLTRRSNSRNQGRFAIGAGALIALAGAINYADSTDVWYEHNGYDCKSYYIEDRRHPPYPVERDGFTCYTKRYYSHRWGGMHEYFVTDCDRNGRFITFERNRNIWGY